MNNLTKMLATGCSLSGNICVTLTADWPERDPGDEVDHFWSFRACEWNACWQGRNHQFARYPADRGVPVPAG